MLKTKTALIDCARKLFATNGFEETTMMEIAKRSGKGRRTLYMYFKSKEEIYYAVIQTELNRVLKRMEAITQMKASAEEKLLTLIFSHLEAIKEAVLRNGNMRAEFFRDIWKVESVRKNFDLTQISLIRRLMNEGIDNGEFFIPNVKQMSVITYYCVKGCEVPYISGRLAVNSPDELLPYVKNMVHKALTAGRQGFVY